MKPVGCEILMLENPHRCNRRPFLSSNLRNRGWSSNNSHFVVPTEVAQLLPDVPASNGGAEGHSLCQSLKNRCKRIWYIFMPQHHKLIQDEGVLHDMLTQLQEVWDAIEQTSESLRMHEFSCYKSDFLLKPQTAKNMKIITIGLKLESLDDIWPGLSHEPSGQQPVPAQRDFLRCRWTVNKLWVESWKFQRRWQQWFALGALWHTETWAYQGKEHLGQAWQHAEVSSPCGFKSLYLD